MAHIQHKATTDKRGISWAGRAKGRLNNARIVVVKMKKQNKTNKYNKIELQVSLHRNPTKLALQTMHLATLAFYTELNKHGLLLPSVYTFPQRHGRARSENSMHGNLTFRCDLYNAYCLDIS